MEETLRILDKEDVDRLVKIGYNIACKEMGEMILGALDSYNDPEERINAVYLVIEKLKGVK